MINKILFVLFIIVSAGVKAQVGVNTQSPTNTLDVNGDLRVRDIKISSTTEDYILVADSLGVLKKRITDSKGIFRGYLSSDFVAGSNLSGIFKIKNWNKVYDPNNDFNTTSGDFLAPITGLYKIVFTGTSKIQSNFSAQNIVCGFIDSTTNKWILRFSIPQNYLSSVGGNSGATNTFVGLARLEGGKNYAFGISGGSTLLANPSGSSGTGIGTYFEIELIKD